MLENTRINILFLVASPFDVENIRAILSDGGFDASIDAAATELDVVEKLRRGAYDIVLSDHSLAACDGFAALRIAAQLRPDIPVIALSDSTSLEPAIDLILGGAIDYVLKDRLTKLPASITRALEVAKNKESRRQAEMEIPRLNRMLYVVSKVNKLIMRRRDRQTIFNEACKIVVDSGKMMLCWIGTIDKAGDNIRPVAFAGTNEQSLELIDSTLAIFQTGTGPTATAVREGCVEIINNVDHAGQSLPWKDTALRLGIRSFAAFPLYGADHSVGSMNFYAGDVNYFSPDVVDVLRDLASDISFALEMLDNDVKRRASDEQSRKLSRAVEQSPESILITNVRGEIEYVNPKFTALTGYTLEEVIGKNPRILKSGSTTREEYEHLWKTILSGKEWRGDIGNKKKDGTIYLERALIFPIFNEDGAITHFMAVKEDITDRRRTEEALRASEERHRMLIRNQGEGISLCDINNKFIFTNPAAEALFQVPPGTLRGRNWRDFVVPEHRSVLQREDERQTLDDRSTYELDIMTLQNERKNLLITTIKQSDKKGMYAGTFSIFRDITARKKIEEKLRISEEYYRTLIEAAPEAIAIIDNDGKLAFVSSKVYDVFGVPAGQELLGASFIDWVHLDEAAGIAKRFQELLTKGARPAVNVYQLLKNDKTPFWGEVSTSHLHDASGGILGLLVLCRDVTEKIKLEQEYIQSQKMQSLGRLAGGIAHDFNNILGIIIAYSALLSKSNMTPDKFTERLAGLDSAVHRGAALVKQILTFARKTDVVIERVNLTDLLHEHLTLLKQTFPKTIRFEESIGEELPPIAADRTQIHQAILNLCMNARDAMPGGGCITLEARRRSQQEVRERFPAADRNAYVCLTVSDTGEGISEALRKKIFDPFFTTKEAGKGTGLGLSVVFGVVQSHKGFIDVDSEIGRGAAFHLYLPASEEEPKPVLVAERDEAGSYAGSETILLVEDEDFLLEIVRMTLEGKGYRVYAAQDGLEAVRLYAQHGDKIDLVFTDMGLPGISGNDVFKKIRELRPEAKVIFSSGFINPDAKSELYKNGGAGYVQKPYLPIDILRNVRAALDKK